MMVMHDEYEGLREKAVMPISVNNPGIHLE
jgi:hypothetical protein